MNLTEAFRALDALNEDTFSVSDDGIAKLAEFQDNDDLVDEIKVMDPEAETEEELADSYVGKVILDCCVCHSKLYKDAAEVTLNDEGTLANVDEECPYCYSTDGFKVVGQVAAYSEKESDDEDEEESMEDSEEIEESLTESPVATMERPMSGIVGTLSSVMTAHKNELSSVKDKNSAISFLDSIEPEVKNKGYLSNIKEKISRLPDSRVLQFLYNIILKGDGMGTKMESIVENVNNVNVQTDDSIVNVNTDENGKVTVTTEPNAAPAAEGDEMIVPVDLDTQSEIESGASNDEFVDMDVNEFDEESFDELGESFLKETYSNVTSYKTTDVSSDGKKIVVEGFITFDSGNKKKTSFVFEAKDCTKSGKVRFIGENVQITRGKKSFTLGGHITRNKFIAESFNYNYRAKDDAGKSIRVYGTIRK